MQLRVLLPFVSVIALGLLYASLLEKKALEENHIHIQSELDARTGEISEHILEKLNLYAQGLKGLAAAIETVQISKFNYERMSTYYHARDFENSFTGARGIGLIRSVEQTDLSKYLANAGADRPDGTFNLRQLSPHRETLFIIQYIFPESRNKEAIGLDIGSETFRRNAAEKAISTNSIQLTAPITLVQANNAIKHGFLILNPIYDQFDAEYAVGWTYSPLLIDEILSSLRGVKNLNLRISDTADNEIQFYDINHFNPTDSLYQSSSKIELYGRIWTISVTADDLFIAEQNLSFEDNVFWQATGIATLLAMSILVLHLIYSRRLQAANHKKDLYNLKREALQKSNQQLEQQVKERTRQIQQISSFQKSILDSTGYAVIATNLNGLISTFNPAAELLLGYSSDEVVGMTSPLKFHVQDEIESRARQLSKELNQSIEPGFDVFITHSRDGQPESHNWTYVHKTGRKIPVHLRVTSLKDEQGKPFGYVGIAYDITPQLEHEQALSKAKEDAELAAEAKSAFLANMSHEIRTPMNGLIGTLNLLKTEKLSSKGTEKLKNALYSSELLVKIINDILDLSKLESGKVLIEQRCFNLSKMTAVLVSECSVVAKEKGLDFDCNSKITHPFWVGDTLRIRQILLNLINNAIKFTEQGKVTLCIDFDAKHEALVFSIEDTGIGLTEEAQGRLFSRFEQADTSTTRKYGGTGLGLAISKSLVDLMDGNIQVYSQEGQGTEFIVTIPSSKCDDSENTEETKSVTIPVLTGRRILIAEDNKVNQFVLKGLLKKTLANLDFVENGKLAVKAAKKTRYDLILMDVQMPIMDGIEACQLIKKKSIDTSIIAVTANAFEEDKKRYAQVGFDGYIAKPIDENQLYSLLSQHLS